MTHVEIVVSIERPPAEVFNFVSNFESNTRWQSGVEKAWFTSKPPMAVGSTYTQISKFLGRNIEFHFVVTQYEPNKEEVVGIVPSVSRQAVCSTVVRRLRRCSTQA